jgi:phosphatidylinositol 4-kinase B
MDDEAVYCPYPIVQTLWFMQASLKDLAQNPESASFHICQRVLHECHEIIFGNLPPSSSTPYSILHVPFYSRFSRKKIKSHVVPALIGMGMILAGVPGSPKLTEVMGQVAVEQGRVNDERSEVRSLEPIVPETVPPVSHPSPGAEDDEDEDEEFVEDPGTSSGPPDTRIAQSSSFDRFSRRKTVGPSHTSPALLARKTRLSLDPFGQFDSQQLVSNTNPFQSTPSVSLTRQHRTNNLSEADVLLQQYDMESRMHLLRSHFCRSEVRTVCIFFFFFHISSQVQFLLTLENISNRLLVVPKPARVSALRAELTALNHMLPAEVLYRLYVQ